MKILLHLLRIIVSNKIVIATVAAIAITSFLLISFPTSIQSRSILNYTKIVTWDRLWAEARLKSFQFDRSEQNELHRCQLSPPNSANCPSYFAWIHEDLAPWKESGISQQNIADAKPKADFRVVIVDGKLYTEQYHKCFQTRDDYTLWGLLMLLEEYPGMVPDLELMFVCGDHPQILRKDYEGRPPAALFAYCTTKNHYDIAFPDWSFWGWPEVNIAPWSMEKQKIVSGAKRSWFERQPVAHWKGNVWVGTPVRTDLLQCNSTSFKVVIYHQDWDAERRNGFQTSSLSQQCSYRYKVYAEGRAWSVSLKYIMACGSTMLHIEPEYLAFFSRSMLPFVQYWPVSRGKICPSIKFAVDWCNAYPSQAEAIGACARSFLDKEVSMDRVYEYMLHLLRAYAKLLKFKPAVPAGVQPMTLNSTLPWHEVTLPKEKRTGDEESRRRLLCRLPGRDEASMEALIATQTRGYQKTSQQE